MEQTAYDSILLFGPIPENLKNEIATYLENIYGISHLSLGDSQRKYEEKCENTENQEETKTELEGKKILLIARELGSNNDLLQDKPMIISFSESQIIYENANNQQFLNRLLKYYHNPIFFFSENPNPVTPKKAFKFTLFKQPIEPISQEKNLFYQLT